MDYEAMHGGVPNLTENDKFIEVYARLMNADKERISEYESEN